MACSNASSIASAAMSSPGRFAIRSLKYCALAIGRRAQNLLNQLMEAVDAEVDHFQNVRTP